MRKLLFAHDDRVIIDDSVGPRSYNYTRALIDRYRYLADQITFAVRCEADEPVFWHEDATIICIPEMKHGRSLLRYHEARRKVERVVDQHDLVVARLPSLIGSWALRAAWRTRKPVLVEYVGCPWDGLWNHSLKGKLVAPIFYLKNRWLVQKSKSVIYVTEKFLQSRYPTSGTSLACSNVEVNLASQEAMRVRFERLSTLQAQSPIVLGTIANLDVPYKGHDLVIRALGALGTNAQRFVYRLIGPGDPKRLQTLAEACDVSEQMEYIGGLSHEKIPKALDEVDVYLQPSKQEGLPRAMIEAMARGCVVIGAKTGGIPELLPSEWVVPKGDWKAIAQHLSALHGEDLVFASQQNWQLASQFRLEALTRKRERFYDQFLLAHGLKHA